MSIRKCPLKEESKKDVESAHSAYPSPPSSMQMVLAVAQEVRLFLKKKMTKHITKYNLFSLVPHQSVQNKQKRHIAITLYFYP